MKVGDEVQAGDLVARSGNTRCSTGPHLHFHVRQPLDGSTWRSVPVRFCTSTGQPEVLTKGVSYTATPGRRIAAAGRGKPPTQGLTSSAGAVLNGRAAPVPVRIEAKNDSRNFTS